MSAVRRTLLTAVVGVGLLFALWRQVYPHGGGPTGVGILPYPAGCDFAFTITDDPDDGWLQQKKVVYDFLRVIGLRTSVGVWVFRSTNGSGGLALYDQGVSLEDPAFLAYTKELKEAGFELFLHTVSGGNDTRERTIAGFDAYRRIFGEYPRHWANHFADLENIYWGYKRFRNPVMRTLYRWYQPTEFSGDDPRSLFFWGDYCAREIRYVRGWASADLNTLKFNPSLPYHDPDKPYVRYWYGCSDGADRSRFNRLISTQNVDRLVRERGAAIIYTHFASGFVDRTTGELDRETKALLSDVASRRNGWFVPVGVMLDRFLALRSVSIQRRGTSYLVVNSGGQDIEHLMLEISDPGGVRYRGVLYRPTAGVPARLEISNLPGGALTVLEGALAAPEPELPVGERFRLATAWIVSRLFR